MGSMLCMERITGPYKGYFIAAYSVTTGDSHAGYAKISMEQPRSVWSVTEVEKLIRVSGGRTELEAVIEAERKARLAIAHLAFHWHPATGPGALM